MSLLRLRLRLVLLLATALLAGGCTTTSLVLGVAGVATDTNLTWAIVKHVHDKLTDGDPRPCHALDSVQRALSARCGDFQPGSLRVEDVAHTQLPGCALGYAAQEPRFWPVLPELLDKGAQPARCAQSPLLRMAQQSGGCPDFAAASPAVRDAIVRLAEDDPRAVRHDVMRMLSCPSARLAGLDRVIDHWMARGALAPEALDFSALAALHPSALGGPLAQRLEAAGHRPEATFAGYDGRLPPGFEAALRGSHWSAIDWWLVRQPDLLRGVPAAQGDQLPWLPLARVLAPSFLEQPQTQPQLVAFLLSRGADPRQRLPFDTRLSVAAYAKSLHSPVAALLDAPPSAAGGGAVVASTAAAGSARALLPREPEAR